MTIDFNGRPVRLTLDASGSSDQDGDKLKFRWLSGTPAADSGDEDAGTSNGAAGSGEWVSHQRWVPAGADPNWPDDVEQPEVELGEGSFSFVLWAIDTKGAVSLPSSLTITVAAPIDPALQSCVDSVLPSVARGCAACVCAISDECKAAANMSVCGADCWGLINCIGAMCPKYAMGDMGDLPCVSAQCSAFLGGASGATMLGGCARMCTDSCRAP